MHSQTQAAHMRTRIAVKPWFFCVEGVLYVEHGHEFDPMCSYGDPLLPTCKVDAKRIRPTPFSVLLRQVARPTRGLSSASYSYVGMGAYVHLLRNLGLRGSAQIAVRYTRACSRLVHACFQRAVDGGLVHMRRAEGQLRRFIRASGVSGDTLSSLRALYVAPAVQSFDFVVRSLYLDRIFTGLLAFVVIAVAAAYASAGASLGGAALCALPAVFLGGYSCIGRGTNTSPKDVMRGSAERIAELFRTPWVVMGHVHEPAFVPMPSGATYVNLGSWGHDDPPDEQVGGGHVSSCTFLTLKREGDRFVGRFAHWDKASGAVPFAVSPAAPAAH